MPEKIKTIILRKWMCMFDIVMRSGLFLLKQPEVKTNVPINSKICVN